MNAAAGGRNTLTPGPNFSKSDSSKSSGLPNIGMAEVDYLPYLRKSVRHETLPVIDISW
jgi:hypothetical protein